MELLVILASFSVAALLCLLVRLKGMLEFVSVAVSLVAFVETVSVALKVAYAGTYNPFPLFSVDGFGAIVMLIIAFVGLAATIYSCAYLRRELDKGIIGSTRVRQYFVLLNLFFAAMFLAISSNSPIVTWISIEATTLSTAFLISFYNKPSAMEAAWKYLMINSVGLLLGFFGTLLYFTAVHTMGGGEFVTWASLAANATHLDPVIAKVAFVFVLIGYGTKVGLAPMHTWLPDAHSKAPAPVSALLSGVLLNVAMVVVLRFRHVTDAVSGPAFSQNLLILFGVLSILFAALIIVTQKNYKRLLAYSSIENMGIIALGFGFGGIGAFAAILHMIYHALLKSALFMSAGTIFLKFSSTKIARVRGVLAALPVTGVLFTVGFFAITGMPPFGIFLTKLLVLSAGIASHLAVSVVVVLLMAMVFVGFFKHASAMVFGERPADVAPGELSTWLVVPPMALIATALILSLHLPQVLQILLHEAALRY